MAIGYLDVFCGISGDMFLGAVVDAGVAPDDLRAALGKLPMAGWEISVKGVRKSGLRATQVRVTAAGEHPHHHGAGNGQHGAPRRSAQEVMAVIRGGQLPAHTVQRAIAVVERIAVAEARCHGVPLAQVHFHELGGLDTIIDVVGTVVGLELLGIERLHCSPLPITRGYVNTAHGRLPVPAPAVAELLRGAPTYGLDLEGETVTPTGAALAMALAEVGTCPSMRLERIGWGAGSKDFALPNLLRLFVGQASSEALPAPSTSMVQLQTNLDDMSGELYGRAMEQAFAAGAVDVWATPIQMKKNRPAVMMSALAPPETADAVARAMFVETTTLGVRRQLVQRQCLDRDQVTVPTVYGPVRMKRGKLGSEVLTLAPEYADCLAAAEAHRVPVKWVHQQALAAYAQVPEAQPKGRD